MPTLVVKTRDGRSHELAVSGSATIMEAIRDAGIDELLALCGGSCSCATCHIYVDDALADRLDSMSEDENDLLDSSEHRKQSSRLSCQVWVKPEIDVINVEIAPED